MITGLNKIRIFIYGSMISALVLGVFDSAISFYIDENIYQLSPMFYLTALTIVSILLFLIAPIIIYKLDKRQKIREKELDLYFLLNISIGTMTSLFSLFILNMWWV